MSTPSAGIQDQKGQKQIAEKAGVGPKAAFDPGEEMPTSEIFRTLGRYLWPKEHPELKRRVVASLGLLIMGKLLNVQVSKMSALNSQYFAFLGSVCV